MMPTRESASLRLNDDSIYEPPPLARIVRRRTRVRIALVIAGVLALVCGGLAGLSQVSL